MKTSSLVAAAFMLLATCAAAEPRQENRGPVRTVHELILNDGSRAYGEIEAETDVEVVFRTTAGALVHAPRSQVVSLKPVAGRMIEGEFRRDDPNSTRLLFGPTGRAIPRGQTYLGVYEALVPFVQVGVTNRFSIGGGTPLIFDLDLQRLYWVTPKLQVYSDGRTHAAVGVFQGFAGGDGDSAGIAYGVVTHETNGGAITVGGGMGYTSEGDRGGVFMIGGESSARRNIKFITESYVWRSAVVTSGGCRFFGEHLSADLAIAVAFGDESTFAFPVVNFVYRF
jgi:hypothetical protein